MNSWVLTAWARIWTMTPCVCSYACKSLHCRDATASNKITTYINTQNSILHKLPRNVVFLPCGQTKCFISWVVLQRWRVLWHSLNLSAGCFGRRVCRQSCAESRCCYSHRQWHWRRWNPYRKFIVCLLCHHCLMFVCKHSIIVQQLLPLNYVTWHCAAWYNISYSLWPCGRPWDAKKPWPVSVKYMKEYLVRSRAKHTRISDQKPRWLLGRFLSLVSRNL